MDGKVVARRQRFNPHSPKLAYIMDARVIAYHYISRLGLPVGQRTGVFGLIELVSFDLGETWDGLI